ncbi:unnamed protein product [Mytilus coruscus]|uniref:Uncharacterized protein n=1 Tax=Mytilus coruscus TaxID=42192 RepID=A0A6J8BHH7_MYTCO|nr:unnamed protein product [Mytilus coruscus]
MFRGHKRHNKLEGTCDDNYDEQAALIWSAPVAFIPSTWNRYMYLQRLLKNVTRLPKQSSAKSQLINVNQVTGLDDSGPTNRARKTIPVKSVPLLILEDACSQETCKSEQACLSQTSDSSICNSSKLEALNRFLSFSENGNGENCTTTCTKEARITVFKCPEDSCTRQFSTSAAVMSKSS